MANFIAASKTDVDALCATVKALRADVRHEHECFESEHELLTEVVHERNDLRARLSEVERARDQLSGALSVRDTQLKEVERERDQLRRGEFICRRCGLRKDAEFERGDF